MFPNYYCPFEPRKKKISFKMLKRVSTSVCSTLSRCGSMSVKQVELAARAFRSVASAPITTVTGLRGIARSTVTVPRPLKCIMTQPFATQAAAVAAEKPDMFCFQCEQTEHGSGCTAVGVCGKTPETAALQDLLVHCLKGISQWAARARALGASDAEIDRFTLKAMFSTLTNVNFDSKAIAAYIQQASKLRDKAKAMYEKACVQKGVAPQVVSGPFDFKVAGASVSQMHEMGKLVCRCV